jgi:hypothetical protein
MTTYVTVQVVCKSAITVAMIAISQAQFSSKRGIPAAEPAFAA